MGALWTQLYPPAPVLTEKELPSQKGKTFIVTGGNAGIGFELVKILWSKGAKVYIAGRSKAKCEAAIHSLEATATPTCGQLKFLHLDLEDLNSVRKAAAEFAAAEDKLDVLWNNAGVGVDVTDTVKRPYDLAMRINCVGPFLFTTLLLPLLRKTAKSAPANSVRVIWTCSGAVETNAPKGGLVIAELSTPSSDKNRSYAVSKAGNWLLASEFGRRNSDDGVISLVLNPGQLKTDIWTKAPKWAQILLSATLHDPIYGAYTELWAGLSPDVTVADTGRYVMPWGRWHTSPRKDILLALKSVEDGGTGQAIEFWSWCEEQTKP